MTPIDDILQRCMHDIRDTVESIDDPVERFHLLENVVQKLNTHQAALSEMRREIIRAERAERWNLVQIGARFGISVSRVSQLAAPAKTAKKDT